MKLWNAAVGTVRQPGREAGALDLSDPKVLFERKRAEMLKLIDKQDRYRHRGDSIPNRTSRSS